jgi:transposase
VDDYIGQDNPVRVIDAFVEELDLAELVFRGTMPALTGRPSYHPGVMLKIYIYGNPNRVPSSRHLQRECQRNVELMWLTGRLAPDFKTVADFRRDNGPAIRNVCRRFVELCRGLKLLSSDMVAIDGSKFKAVNSRDRNFTAGKIDKRQQQIEESVQRYLDMIETADRISPTGFDVKTVRLYEKIALLRQRMRELEQIKEQLKKRAGPTTVAYRSGFPLHHQRWQENWHRRLQHPDCRGYEASSDRRTRGDEYRRRSRATQQDGFVGEERDGQVEAGSAG